MVVAYLRVSTGKQHLKNQCEEIKKYAIKKNLSVDKWNSKVLGFAFGLVAEIEHNLISARTREALALRKSEGVVLGRRQGCSPKMKLLKHKRDEIVDLRAQGVSVRKIAEKYGVSTSTLYVFVKDEGIY